MKTSVEYLPLNKQNELSHIVALINEIVPTELVVLFGSYARNDWVEEKYDDKHYRYQSDFDILVVVETRSESSQSKFERDIEARIDQEEQIHTPVSVIIHDIDFVNRRLSKAQYFFGDIKKEGIILYDSGKFQLNEPRELSNKERYQLAKQDFEYWVNTAKEFFDQFYFSFKKGSYSIAAFLLHQSTERLYSAILLTFTRYKPNTHDLSILRKLANSVDNRLLQIFPLDNTENQRLFKLLRKAYVDARYKPSYSITLEELLQLAQQVEALKTMAISICTEKMETFLISSS